jgi:TPR repeat protein
MRHLALRGHPEAMTCLADWISGPDGGYLGLASMPFSAIALYQRAYRKGCARAARNLALSCFNSDNLPGYRRWLRLASEAGDADSILESRRFETRLWHGAARNIGRLRPRHKRDDFI